MGDWRGGETELSSLFCRLFQSSTNLLTDVSILCADNKLVSAHKLILALSSQYFQDILYPGAGVKYLFFKAITFPTFMRNS